MVQWKHIETAQVDLFANAKPLHCQLWLSPAELNRQLGQDAEASLSIVHISASIADPAYIVLNSIISLRSSACGHQGHVFTAVLTSGQNACHLPLWTGPFGTFCQGYLVAFLAPLPQEPGTGSHTSTIVP